MALVQTMGDPGMSRDPVMSRRALQLYYLLVYRRTQHPVSKWVSGGNLRRVEPLQCAYMLPRVL